MDLEGGILFKPIVKKGLEQLKGFFIAERTDYLQRLKYIRSVFLPEDKLDEMNNYYTGSYDGENYNFRIFDPTVGNIVDRATSGMITYHLNPKDKYFSLTDLFYKSGENVGVERMKALKARTEDIHKLIQLPGNFLAEAKLTRDKMVFGIGGKVIEDEGADLAATLFHYAPEELALGSTNGKSFDIFGVCENLTPFEFGQRFGTKMDDNIFQDKMYKCTGIMGADERKKCYRMNIKREALVRHMMLQTNADKKTEEYKGYEKFINELFPNDEKNPWLDLWFNEHGLITSRALPYHNIIVSQWGPSHMAMGIGKGQGDKAMPLAIMLAEITDINLTGFERTVAAPYVIPSEKTLFGSDFGRDGIIIANPSTGKGMPSILSANIDIRATVEFAEYYLTKEEKLFFLDIFELAKQGRMTTVEVERRGQDDFRRAGMFVVQDEATNLNPTVTALNHIIHNYLGIKDKAATLTLSAQYISALSYAHKNSIFDQTDRVVQSLTGIAALQQNAPKFSEVLDYKGQAEALVKGSDQMEFLLNEEERERITQQNEERMQSENDLAREQAAGAALQNAQMAEEATVNETQRPQP